LEMLAISPGQAGEIAIDAALREAPAAPASEVYSGVLYDHLDLAGLPAAARRRASRQVLIASALWGFVRPGDRIPYYRLSAKARLKRIGPLSAFWRDSLAQALPDEPGALVVDMRSGAYAAAWKPRQATLLAVRAFTEVKGERKAVSHMAKAVRGEVARALLLARSVAAGPEVAMAIVRDAGLEVELGPGTLDVIV
ncbi:MAG TPA: peroxide stress protein YaaA, partial [Solirubrobacterales bacterium]